MKDTFWLYIKALCILTSFWVLHAPESWSKHFFQPFSTFFLLFKPFSVISRLKSLKNVRLKIKGWKRLKKSVSTNFRVRAAPKNWSKYTTIRGPKVLSDLSPSALSKTTSPTQLCHGPKRAMPLNTGRAMPQNISDNVVKTLNQNQAIAYTRRAMPLKMIYNLK